MLLVEVIFGGVIFMIACMLAVILSAMVVWYWFIRPIHWFRNRNRDEKEAHQVYQ